MASDQLDAITGRLKGDLLKALGDAWNKFTPDERKLVEACAADAAEYALVAMAGKADPAVRAEIDASLANIKVAGQGSVSTILWNVAAMILKNAIAAIIAG